MTQNAVGAVITQADKIDITPATYATFGCGFGGNEGLPTMELSDHVSSIE